MRTVLYIIIGLVLQHTICAQSNYLYHIGKKDSVYSNILNEYRDIYVQLPYSYNANSNEKYPVIYILDGDVLLPTVVNVHDFYSGVANFKHVGLVVIQIGGIVEGLKALLVKYRF